MGNAFLFKYQQKSFIGIDIWEFDQWIVKNWPLDIGETCRPVLLPNMVGVGESSGTKNTKTWSNGTRKSVSRPRRYGGMEPRKQTASLSLKKDAWKTIILSFLGRKTIIFSCELRTVSFREGNSQHHLSLSQPCLALLTWTLTKPSCNAFSSVSSTEFPSKYKMFKKAEKYLQFPRIPQSYSQMMTIGCPITSFA